MTAPAQRAAAAESAVLARHLRRLWALPGTRLGIVGYPATLGQRLFLRWHYWWQAHLLDCLVDAQLRAPLPGRRQLAAALIRGHRIRNAGRWGNDYYDDIAWWALALHRAARTFDLDLHAPVTRLAAELADAWSDQAGGGIPWRRGDVFRNTPANGPAAILLARTGNRARAAATVDWIDARLRIISSDLIADGLRPGAVDQGPVAVDETVYTYCQGVVLGAEVELVCAGDLDPGRIHRLVAAVDRHLTRNGVLIGHGGGNGGLFSGILARYLAQVAIRLPGESDADRATRALAARLVTDAADAAWSGALAGTGGPIFAADWSQPAGVPRRGAGVVRGNAEVRAAATAESDLAVQLSAWMLLEAAAALLSGEPAVG